ncbi:chromosome segregation protein SMC, partial [Xanthomonas vasicola pv. vasculorum NCPPB 895]
MEMNRDTRDRIFAAANQLYEAAGRKAFPTVDAVRKAAKVNMNDANAGMKEWRRAQTAQAAPIAVQVPEAVQQLHGQGLAALWQAAIDQASESLRAAQAGWEAERAELDALNKQLGDAYDAQAAELDA